MVERKDSGIPWVGSVPNTWAVNRIAPYVLEVKNPNAECSESNALQFKMGTIISKTGGDSKYHPETLEAYNIVHEGDIIINGLNLQFDYISQRVGICRENGVITSAYLALHPQNINRFYLTYLLKSYDNCKVFHGMGRGLRATLCYDEVKRLLIPIPPLHIQQQIVSILNQKCADIDSVLEKTKASIEEYKKLKQAIITQAVTNGIRGDRPMKESGIKWASTVPSEWEIKRVKRCVDTFLKGNGITKDEVFSDGNTPCVRYGEIYSKYGNTFGECISSTDLNTQNSPQFFSKGDILCAATGELIEEIGKSTAYLGDTPCLAGGDIIIIRHKQDPTFLSYVLNSSYAQAQKSCKKTKLKVVHISASDIGDVIITLPPLEEQREIAEYLDKKCSEINTLIEAKERFIKYLEVYRKSLIYEYVTGKKKSGYEEL